MKDRQKIWKLDYYRTNDDDSFVLLHFLKDYIFQHRLRFIIWLRKAQCSSNRFTKVFYDYKLYRYSRKYGIEIKSETKIGKGFVLTHPYNITISPEAIIGDNVSMMKGSTVGVSNGKKPGAPKIGNRVYIGINSTIIGGIIIGDDVLIAPNTMVNEDIPSHSIVLGNPCIVIPKDNATKEYIWKTV